MAQSLTTQTSRLVLFSASASASDLVADGTPVAASSAASGIPIESAARFAPATGVLQSVALACAVKYLGVEQTMTGNAVGQTEFGVVNAVGDQTIFSVLHSRASAGAQDWWADPGLTSSSTIAPNTLTAAALVGTGQVAFSGTAFRAQAEKASGDAGTGVYAQLYAASGDIPAELAVQFTFAYLAHAIPSFQPDATVRTGLQIDLGSAAPGAFSAAVVGIHNRLGDPLVEASPAVLSAVSGSGDFAQFSVSAPGLLVPSGGSAGVAIDCIAETPGSYAATITLSFTDVDAGYPSTVDTYLLTLDVAAVVDTSEAPSGSDELLPYVEPVRPPDDTDPGRARQGDTVDLICWRVYGATAGITERVLDTNPGLADHGPVLPIGTRVTLPAQAPAAPAKTLKLWD